MDSERKRIIDMLEQGKLNADQAERLLTALGEPREEEATASETCRAAESAGAPAASRSQNQYLHVVVEKSNGSMKPAPPSHPGGAGKTRLPPRRARRYLGCDRREDIRHLHRRGDLGRTREGILRLVGGDDGRLGRGAERRGPPSRRPH